MKLLSLPTAITLAMLGFFAAANWGLLMAPASLNLLVMQVDGPLGAILLGATLVLGALFGVYVLSLRTAALMDMRRHMRELDAQRALADKAEASRFTALGTQLEKEVAGLRSALDAARTELLVRVGEMEKAMHAKQDEVASSLAAHVGQVDDKLDRMQSRT